MKKTTILLLPFFLLVLITSCRKNPDQSPESVSDAKQWFDGSFKKTKEWETLLRKEPAVANLNWDRGVHTKKGNLELLEIPVTGKISSIIVPKDASKKEDMDNILKHSSKSLLIVKREDNFFVLQKEYIPNTDFISKGALKDTSNEKLSKLTNFSGDIVYLSCWGNVISFSNVNGNKVLRSYSSNAGVNSSPNPGRNPITESPLCIVIERQVYGLVCFPVYMDGTYYTDVCGYWEERGSEVQTFCPDPNNGCDEVECTEYGVGSGYIPPPPPEEMDLDNCQELAENAFVNFTDGVQFTSELISVEVNTIDATTKSKRIKWKLIKDNWGQYYVYSVENGITKYVNGKWQWASLTHEKFSAVGIPSGGSIAFSNLAVAPSFTAGTPNVLSARATLDVDITWQSGAFQCGPNTIRLAPLTVHYNIESPEFSPNP